MVYYVSDYKYKEFEKVRKLKRRRGVKGKIDYCDLVCAFDIETTNIDEIENSIMYIWQFQVGLDVTVIGRYWEEFIEFTNKIKDLINDLNLVVYVHNLSFEFQFLKSVLKISEVFAMDDRKVLKFTSDNIEFRCSYIHSNTSLEKYLECMNVESKKVKGFDYNKKRYPFTRLTDDEVLYCINDVKGLVEALTYEMEKDNDDLYTIPLTSTGYVRREFKKVLKPYILTIRDILPNRDILYGLRMAFRGGNTHANRWNANRIIDNVYSYDISSSYPSVMLTERFPYKFTKRNPKDLEKCLEFNRACLMHIYLEDVRLIDESFGCPYLAYGKCFNVVNGEFDNGRILSCDSCDLWITEIDLTILLSEYKFNYYVDELYSAIKKRLPLEFREHLMNMYVKKTMLKDSGDDYSYNKYKNKINSVYGMTVQNPIKPNYIFKDNELIINPNETIDDLINEYVKKGWLPYQWGVWVTAYARLKLEDGLHAIPYNSFIYADTDSIKFTGRYGKKIEKLNDKYIREEFSAVDRNGKKHYLGIYELDGKYKKFKTMGAKKYCYVDEDGLHVTISGVNKKFGAEELKRIENFKEGFTFVKAGGTQSKFNDNPDIKQFKIKNHTLDIYSNVAIYPSTYTLGMTDDYRNLVNYLARMDIEYILQLDK